MNPDDFKQAWQSQTSQTRLTIDADLLLKEVAQPAEPSPPRSSGGMFAKSAQAR